MQKKTGKLWFKVVCFARRFVLACISGSGLFLGRKFQYPKLRVLIKCAYIFEILCFQVFMELEKKSQILFLMIPYCFHVLIYTVYILSNRFIGFIFKCSFPSLCSFFCKYFGYGKKKMFSVSFVTKHNIFVWQRPAEIPLEISAQDER